MERTAMSEVEFRRGAVLRRVADGEVTLKEATPLLGVSYRQAKRIFKRYREQGNKGLVHGNTARRSNRSLPSEYRASRAPGNPRCLTAWGCPHPFTQGTVLSV